MSREVRKTTPPRTASSVEHSPRRPSSVVRTRGRRSVCEGLDVIRYTPETKVAEPPGHNPRFLPLYDIVWPEPGGYIC